MGIEKKANLTTMRTCEMNFGVRLAQAFSLVDHDNKDRYFDPLAKKLMAKKQLVWLFKKGDVVLSNKPKKQHEMFGVQFKEIGIKTGEVPIYAYPGEDVPEGSQSGKSLY